MPFSLTQISQEAGTAFASQGLVCDCSCGSQGLLCSVGGSSGQLDCVSCALVARDAGARVPGAGCGKGDGGGCGGRCRGLS